MDNLDKNSLLKELEFYSRLLEKHESLKKEKELKFAISQQSNKPKYSHSYTVKKNQNNAASCSNQKYLFKKPTHLSIADQNKRNGLYNQRQSFNSKYSLSKNKFSNKTLAPSSNEKKANAFASPARKKKSSLSMDCDTFLENLNDSAVDKLEQNLLAMSSVLTAPVMPEKSEISHNKVIQPSLSKISSKLDNKKAPLKKYNSPANISVCNSKNLNSNASIVHVKAVSDSKSESIKVPCGSSNGSGKSTYNTKDFIREIESLTELLKKKTSGSSHKNLNAASKCKSVMQSKQISHNKGQNNTFNNINFVKKQTGFSKTKCLVGISSRTPANVNYANRNYFMNSNNKHNLPQQKAFNLNKFVYNKNNVKPLLNRNTSTSLKNIENTDKLKDRFQKTTPRSSSRKVIFSDSKNLSHNLCTARSAALLQMKPSCSSGQELVMKLHTPNKIISSTRKVLKKSPHASKIKSPVLFKIKSSNAVKAPKILKLKQSNTRYKKINKHLTTPNKRIQLHHPIEFKSSKRIKKKVNKYKVINRTLKPSPNEKIANALCSPVCKKNSLSMDCDSFLENLNNSAVDKLEKNLLAMSSVLTAPVSSDKKASFVKVNSKLINKKTLKKSKSRISKYKIINSTVSQKYSLKNMQSVHVVSPPKQEKVVLVRRLFKSKNVIINKNASPINYRARLIKSKYLALNKRKSPNWQKYMHPTVSQHPKYKESFLATKLHPKQKRFKTYAVSTYQSSLVRKTNYGYQSYKNKLIYKNSGRKLKNKTSNRYAHSPVVFIRGAKYARNLNGKTLRKLPIKSHTAKSFQRARCKLILRTPENFIKASPVATNLASRVLHRSINRILMASSKKSLSKVNTYCMFYNRFGRCNRGVKCSYIHDPSKIAVCTRFLRGTCKIDGCPFSHEVDPGKIAICSFFLVGQCDKKNCSYRHEKLSPNAVLCKEFVQGYCRFGKECKKAHILICPKYMQGECDKGSSCAFPHPPHKAKKNIQKEVEDEEPAEKPTEILLEKVLRYFQQGGDSPKESNEKSTTNLFVPKQKRLEEQPSFIPLTVGPAVIHSDK